MSQFTAEPDTARDGTSTSGLPEQRNPTSEAPSNGIVTGLGWVFGPVLAHRRALLWLNLVYFGAMLIGALYTAVDPGFQRTLLDAVGLGFSPGTPLGTLGDAYRQGALVSAIALTFVVNLGIGSVLEIGVFSLVVPFGGVAFGVVRAILWGILFAPTAGMWGNELLPHLGTMLVEGEAYVVAMLGVWLWWWPVVTSPGRRLSAWWTGLKLQGRIYIAVAVLLAVAAIYEALEVIYLVPLLA